MGFLRTEHFKRAYRRLEPRDRERVKKALAQLLADRTHPGLHVKRVQSTERIWEMRAGRDIRADKDHRITFEIEEDVYVLRNVGHHDATLRRP